MNYNFLDFTKERYPQIWEEFHRYKRKDTLPVIGTEVLTLVSGYGGYAGVTRYVVAHDDRYIHLAHVPTGIASSLCRIDDWWKELRIVSEPQIDEKAMSKEELIEVLRTSLPSRRMLQVVSIGAVKVGDELIMLKHRPFYEFKEDEAILYNEHHDMNHLYREIQSKTVIFDNSLISVRGRLAIQEYLGKGDVK